MKADPRCIGSVKGKTTIRLLGLNRSDLREARSRRLETLRKLLRVRELLTEKIALGSTRALVAELANVDALLRESKETEAEYSAMARAFLSAIP